MKTFTELTTRKKAGLLHQWFPGETAACLEAVKMTCITDMNMKYWHRARWSNEQISFDRWLEICREINTILDRKQEKLVSDSTYFSGQLFKGDRSIFTISCLLSFVRSTPNCPPKFAEAVKFFFD